MQFPFRSRPILGNMVHYYFFLSCVCLSVIQVLYILSETVGEPTIHEHTYAHQ